MLSKRLRITITLAPLCVITISSTAFLNMFPSMRLPKNFKNCLPFLLSSTFDCPKFVTLQRIPRYQFLSLSSNNPQSIFIDLDLNVGELDTILSFLWQVPGVIVAHDEMMNFYYLLQLYLHVLFLLFPTFPHYYRMAVACYHPSLRLGSREVQSLHYQFNARS